MAEGLFYVYTDPGAVPEAEFHDWYDHEHGPARLSVPGIRNGRRYQALDDQKPPWLALYELDDPDVIGSPEYAALSAGLSDRDKAITSGLAVLDRRVYSQLSSDGPGGPASVILAVALSVPAGAQDDLAAWYAQEHVPMLLGVPGWRRIRRYRLARALDSAAPEFLSLHEIADALVFREPAYQAAVSTPWRDRVVASALRRERRVFGYRNEFGA
jgi:hypothetical protein